MVNKDSKIVVTGGAGFIGSTLVDELLHQGYSSIHVVDNFMTGVREYVNPKAKLHEIDVREYESLLPVFKGAELVFHLAAQPRIQPSIQDPITAHSINTTGTLNVLWAAYKNSVKRVVYSASSSAYGTQTKLPLTEDMAPQPLNPYAVQKYIGEVYMRMFSELYGVETVSLRYFNVYGPRQPTEGAYATVIGIFLRQREHGDPMTIVPDGGQRRDFTHVRDVVRANLLAATNPRVGRGEVINIGTKTNYSVKDVASLIGGPTVFIDARLGEARETLAEIQKARELLGWEPTISFDDGIREVKRFHHLV